ncbi:MAG: DUF5671 domain-containing protein [Acidimicrobiia bacterium]
MARHSAALDTFVREALVAGATRPDITVALERAGWPADQIERALGAYAEIEFPIPVPRPEADISPRDAFIYLTLFTALGLAAYNLGAVLFELIEVAFPDPAIDRYGRELTWNIAYLVVAFPVFVVLSFRQERALAGDPTKRLSKVRRWLTYLAMFVAAGFVIGDAVTLVRYLLEGELSTRFLLKVVVVALIAGSIFGYYLRDLARDES